MAENDKPLHVSADQKHAAEVSGVWGYNSPHERNRLRAAILACMHRMANYEGRGSDSNVFDEALQIERLGALLVQHVEDHGV